MEFRVIGKMAEDIGSLSAAGAERVFGRDEISSDYSKEVSEFLNNFSDLLSKNESDALDELANWEKKARLGHDVRSGTRLCMRWVETYANRKDWDNVGETLKLLSKKRGQLKGPIVALVGAATKWAEVMEDRVTRVSLLEVLTGISDGKIYLEVERARLVRMLAADAEKEGDQKKASMLLGGVHVEALGGMERREKTEYIIEQMRLALGIEDYIRLEIISRKINPKLLLPDEYADLRLAYHQYLVIYHNHDESYGEAANSQLEISEALQMSISKGTPINTETPIFKGIIPTTSVKSALEGYLVYCILSPIGDEQGKKLKDLVEKKKTRELAHCLRLAQDYLSDEIIPLPLEAEELWSQAHVFNESHAINASTRFSLFHTRILQHNVLVISKYYKAIYTKRLATLCFTDAQKAEELTANLVNEELLIARIDRPGGIIRFGVEDDMPQRLDRCHADLQSILSLAEETTHMIQKEDAIRIRHG